MIVEFKIPDLGESIDSGEVVKLMVKIGDVVEPEQAVMELETGKAVVEVPADVKGRIAEILVAEGEQVNVGQAVLKIETDLGAGVAAQAPPPAAPTPAPPAKKPPAKTTAPVADPAPAPAAQTAPAAQPAAAESGASPGARRLARELNLDLPAIAGTGPAGLILEDDVRSHARKAGGAAGSAVYKPLPDFSRFGPIKRASMSNVRLATAEHMAHAWLTVPQVTQYDSADITDLNLLRKRYAPKVEAMGGKLTLTAVLVKVVASALRQFPHFNVSVDMTTREIIEKDYVNVGVAVDTARGLLVPVIKDADKKNIAELSVELLLLGRKAHDRQLGPPDLEGGTFSVTNLGTVGGTHFTPIVNWPEAAILGISRANTEPVWKEKEFVPRLMLQLSLSYDHRVIDGADGARFLRWICEALEQPFFLALEG